MIRSTRILGTILLIEMYKVKEIEFEELDDALKFATTLNEFVVIAGNGLEIVGKFGVDSIKGDICPNGEVYCWKKRRR